MEEVVLEELQIFKVRHSPEFWEERCWNWIALDIWHLCFNTSSLFLENSLQITPLFFFLKQWEKVFKATKNRTHLSLKNSTEFRAPGVAPHYCILWAYSQTNCHSRWKPGVSFTIQMLFSLINFTFQFFLNWIWGNWKNE